MSFQCTVITPEEKVMDETVSQVILPAHDGQMGILTSRAPVLVRLGAGPLRADIQGGASRTYFVEGGIAQMKDDKLTILTDEATPADQIDLEAARAEFAQASATVPTDEKSRKDRERAMRRARARQAVAGR